MNSTPRSHRGTIRILAALAAALMAAGCSKDNAVDARTTECGDNTLDCVPCAAGEHRCDGAVLKVCQADGQGFDALMSCVTEALCVKGLADKACAASACNAADTKCDGAKMIVCAEGRDKLEITECTSAAACTAGLKSGKCAAGECSVASECSGEDSECRKRSCNAGVCGWQDVAQGTSSTTQQDGDCRRRICDGQGGATTEPLPADIPNDGNECTVGSCDGSTPKATWAPAGTVCSGTGLCDGAGNCSTCVAGSKKCNGNSVRTCQAGGQWDLGTACVNSACVGGECAGVCEPGKKQCDGQVPRTCDANGVWQGSQACPESACVDGECIGGCVPASTKCVGNDVLTCDATGQWPAAGSACAASACVGGACVGSCVPGGKRCPAASVSQVCDASGAWQSTVCTGPLAACVTGECVSRPSCAGLEAYCGPTVNESCCAWALVPEGSYPMGRSESGTDAFPSGYSYETPEHTASVSDFRLELYEVTVGRFRKFVDAYPGSKPVAGAGANPNVSGTGWDAAWTSKLPADSAALRTALQCEPTYATWRDSPSIETLPINCVTWFEAFAFCAWDGGRLPTEAEWEKAAAGGDENRLYPWGQATPTSAHASYQCTGDGSAVDQCWPDDIVAVGSMPAGAGRWGHHDLAGNMVEWVFDWYSDAWFSGAGNTCSNCANTTNASYRMIRGGGFSGSDRVLRAANRGYNTPTVRGQTIGFRCARTSL